jgi:fatty-acid desaturase
MKSFMKIVTDILRYTINIVYSFLIFIMMICVLTIIFLIFILDGISHYFSKRSETREEKYKQQWYQLIEEFNRYVKENR